MLIAVALLLLLSLRIRFGVPKSERRAIVTLLVAIAGLYIGLLCLYQLELIYAGRELGIYGSDAALYYDYARGFLAGNYALADFRTLNGWGFVIWDAAVVATTPKDLGVVMIKVVNILLLLNALVLLYRRFDRIPPRKRILMVAVVAISGGIAYTVIRNLKETLLLWLIMEYLVRLQDERRSVFSVCVLCGLAIVCGTLRPFIYVPMALIPFIQWMWTTHQVPRHASFARRFTLGIVGIVIVLMLMSRGPFQRAVEYAVAVLRQEPSEHTLYFRDDPWIIRVDRGGTIELLLSSAMIGIPRYVVLPVPLQLLRVGIINGFGGSDSYYEGAIAFLLKFGQSLLWWLLMGFGLVEIRRLFSVSYVDLKIIALWEIVTRGIKLLGAVDVRSKMLMYAFISPLLVYYWRPSNGRTRLLYALALFAMTALQAVYIGIAGVGE